MGAIRLFFMLVPVLAHSGDYRHPERKFSFTYNDNQWEVVSPTDAAKSGGQDIDRAMASRTLVTVQRKLADDKYRARFSVVIDDLKKFKGTPSEQSTAYQKHATAFMKGQRFHILSTKPRPLDKVKEPAFEIVANQRDFGLTFRQVIFLKGEEAYLLTVATRTAKFEEYEKETKSFFESFHFQ